MFQYFLAPLAVALIIAWFVDWRVTNTASKAK